ncbi:hypothetical protein B0H16DRAFT_1652557, partial [Mycena metata]
WDCANGDLLEHIAKIIRARRGPVSFHHIHEPLTNSANTGARKLALAAASANEDTVFPLPDAPETSAVDTLGTPKCTTSLPTMDLPKRKPVLNITAAQLAIGDSPDAHRNRLIVHRIQSGNLNRLLNSENIREWWEVMKGFINAKQQDARVTVHQLRETFRARLNPPAIMPAHFDADLKRLHDIMSEAIPRRTADRTPEQFFTRPWELPEIEKMKRKIRNRSSKSARGIDQCSYKKIQSIPNDALLTLFNYCIMNCTGAQDWFTTLLVGILKMGKSAEDPESYRLIGLECCLLKCLTLLIDM